MLNMMAGLIAALFLVPCAVAVADDDCIKSCGRYETTDLGQLRECKDVCAFEADYKAMRESLDACNRACDASKPPGGRACKDVCAVKVDAVADSVATRACYRDCARNPGGGARRCEESCDRAGERDAAFVEKDAVARLDGCFKRCAWEHGGEVAARVNACKEACPLVRFVKDKLLMGKATHA